VDCAHDAGFIVKHSAPTSFVRAAPEERPAGSRWRARLHEVIYEADTPLGKTFDVCLLMAILLSILAVCLESVATVRAQAGTALRVAEWTFTLLFSVEYVLRLAAVRRPWRYARSFFGIVDLLAILPTYLSFFLPGAQSLLVVRALRLLRVFRVLKLVHFVRESRQLAAALRASARKIVVFLVAVLTLVLIMGALMYLVEGPVHGFTSIPASIYWAIVTMTTVGFGDIVPQTPLGQILASLLMIMGYAIIAVPTGIVTVGLAGVMRQSTNTQACPSCGREGHADDARFCKYCGSKL
jgi:voltage-gated potassium channel